MRSTPLYDEHIALGAKVVPFAGWNMPVRYTGFLAEHEAVRQKAGLFDVSHMGELFVTGEDAEKFLNWVLANDVSKLVDGKAQYSLILNENGGVVDDVIVYRFTPTKFLVCVNASNADKDFEWISSRARGGVKVENHSDDFGLIAIQGPEAKNIIASLLPGESVEQTKTFYFVERKVAGYPAIIARTGYTGEDGFELFVPTKGVVDISEKRFLEVGAPHGLVPCGLGARDTLRLEAGLPLHGHELSEEISALESGLAWVVKLDKGEFIGREALQTQRDKGLKRSLVGFKISDAGIAREHDRVLDSTGKDVGEVMSGSKTPTVQAAIGTALIPTELSQIGTHIFLQVRQNKLAGEVVKLPFYKRPA